MVKGRGDTISKVAVGGTAMEDTINNISNNQIPKENHEGTALYLC